MMDLVFRRTEVSYYFSEPGSDRPDYRRDSLGNWEARFGDAWEPMGETADLEAAFAACLQEKEILSLENLEESILNWKNAPNILPFVRMMEQSTNEPILQA